MLVSVHVENARQGSRRKCDLLSECFISINPNSMNRTIQDLIVGPAQDTLHRRLGRLLDCRDDFVVGRPLLNLAREVDDGHVRRRHAEGHTRELAVERGNDLAGWTKSLKNMTCPEQIKRKRSQVESVLRTPSRPCRRPSPRPPWCRGFLRCLCWCW